MHRTGSLAIAYAVLRGRGGLFAATGLLVLITSAVAHASFAHLVAALVFGLGLVAIRLLARMDAALLGTPWARVARFTDLVSLVVVGVATFGPLAIVATRGVPASDLPVLAGVLLFWWSVLDVIIADYRRIRAVLVMISLSWLPVVLFHPTNTELALAIVGLTALGALVSGWSVVSALKEVPAQYRVIDVADPDTG